MALLAIALLASAVLVTELNNKALQFSRSAPYSEAQDLSQKVAYTIDRSVAESNSSHRLEFNPGLQRVYNITVQSGQVVVSYEGGSSSFPTAYDETQLSFNTSQSYVVSFNGSEVHVK